jgi:antitoxin VapB
MATVNSRVFRSGNSEAVRLPKEVAYGADIEVTVERHGDVVTIRPKMPLTMKEMLRQLRELPKPDTVEVREPIEFPERPGL